MNRGPEMDEGFLQGVLDELPGVVYVYDIQRRKNVYVNRRWLTDYGYTVEETRASDDVLAAIVHPDDLDAVVHHHAEIARTKEPRSVRYRVRAKSGAWIWLESSDRPFADDASGRLELIVGSARDVTTEVALRRGKTESEARFRTIVERLPDAVFIGDRQGRFQLVNSAACEQLGYTRDELMTLGVEDIIAPEYRERARGRLNSGVASGYLESEHLRKDASRVPVEVCVVPFEMGGDFAFLGVARDIRERRRMEEHLRETQRLDAIGRLAGAIAHDFNNLLAVIVGGSEILEGALPPDEAARSTLDDVSQAAERGAGLTRQLLMFSRRQPAQMAHLDLGEHVERALRTLRHLLEPEVRIETTIEERCVVSADASLIEQVVANLIINARDAMPEGGAVHVSVSSASVTDDSISTAQAVLRVSDTGEGIDTATLPHVFEPFFTTKSDGTGLGLAAVYGIVQQHGGHVDVESKPGAGAVFSIMLPLVEAVAPVAEMVPESPASSQQRILVVDDQPYVRRTIRRMLEKIGHAVLEAGSAEEALALYREKKSEIDALLTDVSLGIGQSGPELAAAIEAEDPDLRIIFMSGHDATLTTLPLSGTREFIQKPFRLTALGEVFSRTGGTD